MFVYRNRSTDSGLKFVYLLIIEIKRVPNDFYASENISMEDYKKLLTDLYSQHDPERIKQIDYFLEKYKGKEEQFLSSQKSKYKSRKPISDSKKIIEEALARIKSQNTQKISLNEEPEAKPIISAKEDDEISNTPEYQEIPKEEIATPIFEAPIVEDVPEVVENSEEKTTPAYQENTTFYPKEEIAPQAKEPKEKILSDQQEENPFGRQQTTKRHNNDKHFKKMYFLYIFGSVLLVLILVVVGYFLFFDNIFLKQQEVITEKPETTLNETVAESKEKSTEINSIPAKKDELTNVKVDSLAQKTVIKEVNSEWKAIRFTSGSIQLPAYFVACYAVKTEKTALDKISQLKKNGFDAGYYWIPDFNPQGNEFFKVVIGPFDTQKEAMQTLTPVQERAEFDAYVLELR